MESIVGIYQQKRKLCVTTCATGSIASVQQIFRSPGRNGFTASPQHELHEVDVKIIPVAYWIDYILWLSNFHFHFCGQMTVMLNKDKDKAQGQDRGLDPEGRGRDQGLKFLSFKDEERKPRATSLSVDLDGPPCSVLF